MAKYIVSRHQATITWLKQEVAGTSAIVVSHLNESTRLRLGDHVYGNLPFPLALSLIQRGIIYGHIALNLTAEQRGKELPAEELKYSGIKVVTYSKDQLTESSSHVL